MGGKVKVESKLGVGTTFEVTIITLCHVTNEVVEDASF